jgi:hypothetical protein
VRSGKLGRLLWAQGSYCRNNPNGEWNYDIDPDANELTVDWPRSSCPIAWRRSCSRWA